MLLWHFYTNEDSFGADFSVLYQGWACAFCAFLDCVRSAEAYLVPVPDFGGLGCNLFHILYFCLVTSWLADTPTPSITKPQLCSPKCHGSEQSNFKKEHFKSMENTTAACQSCLWKHTSDPKKPTKMLEGQKLVLYFIIFNTIIGAENERWHIPFTNTFISSHAGSIWMTGKIWCWESSWAKCTLNI